MSSLNDKNEYNTTNLFNKIKTDNNQVNNDSYKTLNKNMFQFNYVIGKGGFGKVWQVLFKKTKEPFALKEMSKRKILDKKSEKSINNEMILLKKLNHPFIVNMHYAFQDNENLYLVMDFLSGGDLRFHCSRYRTFSEEQTRFFISCMILGLEHIHQNNVIHRDIKPENLVLDDKGYLRITDFGIARINKNDNSSETSGTPGYMSPEVMRGNNHSFSVDFFAIGVIGYEFMLGKRPYNGKNRKEIKEKMFGKRIKINRNEMNKGWSIESIEFINQVLERKPELRLGNKNGIIELKEHEWLKYYPWKELENKELPAPFIPDQNNNYDKTYCESSEVLTEDTKIRYKKIFSSFKYQNAFKHFYFNKETEERNNIQKEKEEKTNNNTNIIKNIETENIKNDIKNNDNKNIFNNTKEYKQDNNNNFNKNKILINIRKLLYETNNENIDKNTNEKNKTNILIKENIDDNLSTKTKTNNSKIIKVKNKSSSTKGLDINNKRY